MSKDRDSKKRIAFVQLFAEASSSVDVPDEIHVVPTGKWDHPVYGEMEITSAHVREFVQNFKDKVRLNLPITAGHDNGMSGGELPAIGWFKELIDRGVKGLYAVVEWTEEGQKLLTERAFKYFSPEFYEEYKDPETGETRKHVLVGGALTNRPYFKELDPVVAFSEPEIRNQFIDDMNLKDILSKKPEQFSDAEKEFVRDHKSELTAEQTASMVKAKIFDEGDESAEQKAEREAKEAAEKEAADKAAADKKAEEERQAAEKANGKKIVMSEAEVTVLRKAADDGAKALQKIEASERKAMIATITLSESNKEGRFLPKQAVALEGFLKTLSEPQRDQFRELVKNMPKPDASIFTEIGDGGKDSDGSVDALAKEIKTLAEAKVTASNGKLAYSEAVKQLFTEKPELKTAYEKAMADAQ